MVQVSVAGSARTIGNEPVLTWESVGGKPNWWPLPVPGGLQASLGQPLFGLEHARRLDIFAQNLAKAQRLQEEELGTAEFGVTQFSDLTGTGLLAMGGRQGRRSSPADTRLTWLLFPRGNPEGQRPGGLP